MRHSLIAIAILVASAGCTPQHDGSDSAGETAQSPRAVPGEPQAGAVASDDDPGPATNECGADRLDNFVGELATEPVKAEIAEAAGHDRIRYIAPGDMVTQDFRPDRLNVETGEDGRIKRLRCG